MDPSTSVAELAESIRNGPRVAVVLRQLMATVKVMAVAGVQEGFQTHTSPDGKPFKPLKRSRPDGSSSPLQDKGLLQKSVKGEVTGLELVLKASHPGARVHQYGGIIVPRKAKYLSVPLTVEAKRYGSPRRFPKRRNLFVWTSRKTGKKLLAESKNGTLTFHYVLVDSVYIPPRPYLGFSEKTLAKIERVVADRFADSISAIFRPKSFNIRVTM